MSVYLHYKTIPSTYMSGSENILVTAVKKDQQTFYVKRNNSKYTLVFCPTPVLIKIIILFNIGNQKN
jgi:hypothetical protein